MGLVGILHKFLKLLENINLAGSNIDCVHVSKGACQRKYILFFSDPVFQNAVNLSSFSNSFSIIFHSC